MRPTIASGSAPSGSIHGLASERKTEPRSWTQWPAWAQMVRLSRTEIRSPSYSLDLCNGFVVSRAPEYPLVLWLPSQNGLLAEPPHLQSAIFSLVSILVPSGPIILFRPRTISGPFSRGSIVISERVVDSDISIRLIGCCVTEVGKHTERSAIGKPTRVRSPDVAFG